MTFLTLSLSASLNVEHSCLCLLSCLLLFCLFQLQSLLLHTDQLLAIRLLELGDGILIDWVNKQENFKALLLENLEDGRVTSGSKGFTVR
jgi:hypothetical protein